MKDRGNEILVSSNPFENRVALVEGGRLVEFYVERPSDRGLTGNIYKGKVVRVLPGMQSAFIDCGLARTAFLHVSDIKAALNDTEVELDEEEGAVRTGKGGGGGGGNSGSHPAKIQELIREGQEIVVQVSKEPIGTKGARVTSYMSLPGRYLVLMPTYDKVAISRRIESDKERRRLRSIVSKLRPKGYGFIIRTVCDGMKAEDIEADMEYLIKLWQSIERKKTGTRAPAMLYEEPYLTLRTVRDLFSSDIARLVLDSKEEYERVLAFIGEFMPHLKERVELYDGTEDLFDAHGIEIELADALERKVWLHSGGHIVMDQMEALTAIDVNTGRYVGKKSSEHTIVKTNLEAVQEVVYQLRLRNIGGIIVIDFIDMAKASDREKVYNALKAALKADKTRTNILKISDLGIVEMTRKRTRASLAQALCETCPYCEGNGLVRSAESILMEIYRELRRDLPEKKKAVVFVSPAIAEKIEEDPAVIDDLEKRFGKKIDIKPVDRFHQERYEIF